MLPPASMTRWAVVASHSSCNPDCTEEGWHELMGIPEIFVDLSKDSAKVGAFGIQFRIAVNQAASSFDKVASLFKP